MMDFLSNEGEGIELSRTVNSLSIYIYVYIFSICLGLCLT